MIRDGLIRVKTTVLCKNALGRALMSFEHNLSIFKEGRSTELNPSTIHVGDGTYPEEDLFNTSFIGDLFDYNELMYRRGIVNELDFHIARQMLAEYDQDFARRASGRIRPR